MLIITLVPLLCPTLQDATSSYKEMVAKVSAIAGIRVSKAECVEDLALVTASTSDGNILVNKEAFGRLGMNERAAAVTREVAYIALFRKARPSSAVAGSTETRLLRELSHSASMVWGAWSHEHRKKGLIFAKSLLRKLEIPDSALITLLEDEGRSLSQTLDRAHYSPYEAWTGGTYSDLVSHLKRRDIHPSD